MSLGLLDSVTDRFKSTLHKTSEQYSLRDYYFIFILICSYLLLRPYIVRHAEGYQTRKLEAQSREERLRELAESDGTGVKPGDGGSDPKLEKEFQQETWGRSARRRQHNAIAELERQLRLKEEMEHESDSDEEIAEFLVEEEL